MIHINLESLDEFTDTVSVSVTVTVLVTKLVLTIFKLIKILNY